jgi:hypothetical protein
MFFRRPAGHQARTVIRLKEERRVSEWETEQGGGEEGSPGGGDGGGESGGGDGGTGGESGEEEGS